MEVSKYAVVDINSVGAAAFVLPHEFTVGHVSVGGWVGRRIARRGFRIIVQVLCGGGMCAIRAGWWSTG